MSATCPKCQDIVFAIRRHRCSFCNTCDKCTENVIGGNNGWICSDCAVVVAQALIERDDQTFSSQFTHTNEGRVAHLAALKQHVEFLQSTLDTPPSRWDQERIERLTALMDKLS